MKLTWHIVKKDLRRLSPTLALWIAVFLGEFMIGLRLLHGDATSPLIFERYRIAEAALFGGQAAVGYLLVAWLVLEDALVDTAAFWPTRPISGARLMGAKLLACAVIFGALPILVTLPWWLHCGFGAREIAHASLESLAFQVLPVAVGLMIASLATTMGRFLAGTLLAVAAVALASVLLQQEPTHLFFRGQDLVVASGVADARTHVLYWLAVAGCCAVAACQFLTRRLVRSLALLTCATGLLVLQSLWWPWGFRGNILGSNGSAPAAALDAKVGIRQVAGAQVHFEGEWTDPSGVFIYGLLKVENAPPEVSLRFDQPVFEWRWPDGSTSRRQGSLRGWWQPWLTLYQARDAVPFKAPPLALWEQSTWYKFLLKQGKQGSYEDALRLLGDPPDQSVDYYVEVSRPDLAKMLSNQPSCAIELQGDLLQAELKSEVALEEGSRGIEGTGGFRIARARWNERAGIFRVTVIGHRPVSGGTYDPFNYSVQEYPDDTFVAINRESGESAWPLQSENFVFTIHVAGVSITMRSLDFAGPSNKVVFSPMWGNGERTGPSYEEWFSNASLGHIVETATGRFSREVKVDRFAVDPDLFSHDR